MSAVVEAISAPFEAIGDAVGAVGDVISDVAQEVGNVVEDTAQAVGATAQAIIEDPTKALPMIAVAVAAHTRRRTYGQERQQLKRLWF